MGDGTDKSASEEIVEGSAQQRTGQDEFGEYRIDDRIWTMNEIRDHPMFMEDVPSDISDNPHLLALQSLVYDDQTPEELADHFRKLGNDAFKTSTNGVASQNALLAYTKALEMDCKDDSLNSQLHSNRAAVSLRVKEYSRAVDDSRKAIKLDPANAKAYFRAATASEALGLTAQGLDFCRAGLDAVPNESELKKLRLRLQKQLDKEEEQRRLDRAALDKAAKARDVAGAAVRDMLEARGSRLGPVLFEAAMYSRGALPLPKKAEDGEALEWPLLILYDETNQSDFVETFDERCSLDEQLQLMFPADRPVEWDEEGKYVWDRLATYLEYYPEDKSETELIRLTTAEPLQKAIDGLCVPPCLVLYVCADGSPAHRSFCVSRHVKE